MADEDLARAISDLANSLQVAAVLSERLRSDLSERATDAAALRDAIARAVDALRQLQGDTR